MLNLRDWCPYCHKYVNTSQMSHQYKKIDGCKVLIVEYYCTLCCNLIYTEEKEMENGSDNI